MKRSSSQMPSENTKISYKKLANDLGFNFSNSSNMKGNKLNTKDTKTNLAKDINNDIYKKRTTNLGGSNYTSTPKANLNMKNVNYVEFKTNQSNKKSTNSDVQNKRFNYNESSVRTKSNTSNSQASRFNSKLNLKLNNKESIPPPVKKVNTAITAAAGSKPKIMQENSARNNIKIFNNKEENIKITQNKPKPSDKNKVISSDPFAGGKKHKTNFGYVYSAGGIPCRILHGSVKMKLKWDVEIESTFLK